MDKSSTTAPAHRLADWFTGTKMAWNGESIFLALGQRQTYRSPKTVGRAFVIGNQNDVCGIVASSITPLFMQSLCSSPRIRQLYGVYLEPKTGMMRAIGSPAICSLSNVLLRGGSPSLAWRLQIASHAVDALNDAHCLQIAHGSLNLNELSFTSFESGAELQLSSFADTSVCLDPLAPSWPGAQQLATLEAEFGLTRQRPVTRPVSDVHIPPELRGTSSSGTYAGDVYSLGAVITQILCWQVMGAGDLQASKLKEHMAAVQKAAGGDISRLLERCLSPDPSKRPSTCVEVRRLWLDACPPASALPPPLQLWEANQAEAKRLNKLLPPRQSGASASSLLQSVMPVTHGTADCPVCLQDAQTCVPTGCAHRHAVCLPCAAEWIRSEVGQLQYRGVRCPSCMNNSPDGQMILPVLCTVTNWSRRKGVSTRPLSNETLLLACQLSPPLPTLADTSSGEVTAVPLPCMKRCPRCRTPISHPRGHGCHHMTCKCGHDFCYNCLGPHTGSCGCGTGCSVTCLCEDCPECASYQSKRGEGCPTCSGPEACNVCRMAVVQRNGATFADALECLQVATSAAAFTQALILVRHASRNYQSVPKAVQWQVMQTITDRCQSFRSDRHVAMQLVRIAQTDWYQQHMSHALTASLVSVLLEQPGDNESVGALVRQIRQDTSEDSADATMMLVAVCSAVTKPQMGESVRRECQSILEALSARLTSFELQLPESSRSVVLLGLLHVARSNSLKCLKLLLRVLTNPDTCSLLVCTSEHLRYLERLDPALTPSLYTLATLQHAHFSLQSVEGEADAERVLSAIQQNLSAVEAHGAVESEELARVIRDRLALAMRRLRDDLIKYHHPGVGLAATRVLKQTLMITTTLVHDDAGYVHESWKVLEAACAHLPLPLPMIASEATHYSGPGSHPLLLEALTAVESIMVWTALCPSWGHAKTTRKYVTSFVLWCMSAVSPSDRDRLLAADDDKKVIRQVLSLVQWALDDAELASTLDSTSLLRFLLETLAHEDAPVHLSVAEAVSTLCAVPARKEGILKDSNTWSIYARFARSDNESVNEAAAEGIWSLLASPFAFELTSQSTETLKAVLCLALSGVQRIASNGQLVNNISELCMAVSILSERKVEESFRCQYYMCLAIVLLTAYEALLDSYPAKEADVPVFARALIALRDQQSDLLLSTNLLSLILADALVLTKEDDADSDSDSELDSGLSFWHGLVRMGLKDVIQPVFEAIIAHSNTDDFTLASNRGKLLPEACAWLTKEGQWLLRARTSSTACSELRSLADHVFSTLLWLTSTPSMHPSDIMEMKGNWHCAAHPGLEDVLTHLLWSPHDGPSGTGTLVSHVSEVQPTLSMLEAVIDAYTSLAKRLSGQQGSECSDTVQRARSLSLCYGRALLKADPVQHGLSLYRLCEAGLHELISEWKDVDPAGIAAELNVIPSELPYTPFALSVKCAQDRSLADGLKQDIITCVLRLTQVAQLNPIAVGNKAGQLHLWWAAAAGLDELVTTWVPRDRVQAKHLLPPTGCEEDSTAFTLMCQYSQLKDASERRKAAYRKCAVALGTSGKVIPSDVDRKGRSQLLHACLFGLHEVVTHMLRCCKDRAALETLLSKRQGTHTRTLFAEVAHAIQSTDYSSALRADLCLCAEALAAECSPTAVGCSEGKLHIWYAIQARLPSVLRAWLKNDGVTTTLLQSLVPTGSPGLTLYCSLLQDWRGHASNSSEPNRREQAHAVAQCLIALGESKKVDVQLNGGEVGSLCPIYLACKTGHSDLLAHWIAMPDLAFTSNWQAPQASEDSHTPFTIACSVAGSASCSQKLQSGARACAERLAVLNDPTSCGGLGHSALYWACYAGLEGLVTAWLGHASTTSQWLAAGQGPFRLNFLYELCARLRGAGGCTAVPTPETREKMEACIVAVVASGKLPIDYTTVYYICWAGILPALEYLVSHKLADVSSVLKGHTPERKGEAGHTAFTAACVALTDASSEELRTAISTCVRRLAMLDLCSPTALGGQMLSSLYWVCTAGLVDIARTWLTNEEVTTAWLAAEQGQNGRTLFAELCLLVSHGTGTAAIRQCALLVGTHACCRPDVVDRANTSHLYWACTAGLSEVVQHWINTDLDSVLAVLHRRGQDTRHTPFTVACRIAAGRTSPSHGTGGHGQSSTREREETRRKGALACAELLVRLPSMDMQLVGGDAESYDYWAHLAGITGPGEEGEAALSTQETITLTDVSGGSCDNSQ